MSSYKRLVALKRMENLLFSVIFSASLFAPLITMFCSKSEPASMVEKRTFAKMPHLSFNTKSIKRFLPGLDAYYQDHFGFRNRLILLHQKIERLLHGKGDAPRVIFGRNGWLYFAGEYSIREMRRPFTAAELFQWKTFLEKRRDILARKGVLYIFVVAPDKDTIYPEFVPLFYSRPYAKSCLDQLVDYMRENSDLRILDLRPALLTEKKEGQLYFKGDTHWTPLGAYVGYREIMRAIETKYPSAQAFPFNRFSGPFNSGDDLICMLNMGNGESPGEDALAPPPNPIAERKYLPDALNPALLIGWPDYPDDKKPFSRKCPDGKLRALIFHDSFGVGLQPFFSATFARTTYVWDEPDEKLLMHYLDLEHPDVVIEEWVERFLKVKHTK